MYPRLIIISIFLTLVMGHSLQAQSLPNELQALRIDQKMGDRIPLDLRFRDESGKSVSLQRYFKDRPVILVLAYYRCPRLCSQVLNGLVTALKDISLQLGKDYTIITVSIDPKEAPELAKAKKEAYINHFGPTITNADWHFLTGEESNIKQLTKSVGYNYEYDDDVKQYRHSAAIMVLTPEGEVSRYFFGISFVPRDVQLGLVEASQNRISAPVSQVLLLTCFSYDPSTGKYGASAMKLMRVGAVITILCLGVFLGRLWWSERCKQKALKSDTLSNAGTSSN